MVCSLAHPVRQSQKNSWMSNNIFVTRKRDALIERDAGRFEGWRLVSSPLIM